jgi:hypothetical protein
LLRVEYDEILITLGELLADGEAGLTTPDDDGVHAFGARDDLNRAHAAQLHSGRW